MKITKIELKQLIREMLDLSGNDITFYNAMLGYMHEWLKEKPSSEKMKLELEFSKIQKALGAARGGDDTLLRSLTKADKDRYELVKDKLMSTLNTPETGEGDYQQFSEIGKSLTII